MKKSTFKYSKNGLTLSAKADFELKLASPQFCPFNLIALSLNTW